MSKKRKLRDETEEDKNSDPILVIEKETESTTTICNVKVRYLRPQYNNLKEWIRSDSNVYIGRAGVVFVDGVRFPPQNSEWANPFKIGKDGNRDVVLRRYREHIEAKLQADESLHERLKSLKGKCLGCWCVETPVSSVDEKIVCHGQILLQLITDSQKPSPLL